ncbi:MAG TPA: hypothetical protein VGX70_13830 [Gemmataceae bacterium]|nr:hypothetical protein [Gemmataceae bacterium]
MEFLPQEVIQRCVPRRRFRWGRLWIIGSIFALGVCGCVHLPKTGSDDPMPHGQVCQMVATWNHQVVFAPDPAHGGMEAPGLVGRLYLFGPEISYPLIDDGSVVVDLFDDKKQTDEGQPVPLEEWRVDPATLKRLAKRDMIGWGYTLFLPWGTYKPNISQVHLKVRYVTAKGNQFFAESGPLSLNSPSGPAHHATTASAKTNVQTISAVGKD